MMMTGMSPSVSKAMPAVVLAAFIGLFSSVGRAEDFIERARVDSGDPAGIPWGFEAPYWPDTESGVEVTEINGVLALAEARTLAVDYIDFDAPGVMLEAQADPRAFPPRALAMDDFDEDGVPDLVVAQAAPGGGRLVLYRGNVAALFPRSAPAERMRELGTFTRAPFLSPARVFAATLAPDFLGTGDFDNDGHRDVVVGAWGSRHLMTWLGDGRGGLSAGPNIPLAGGLTAAVVGEVHRPDGIADLAVAVDGSEGAQLAVFNGADGVLRAEPEVRQLPYRATAIVFERLDDDTLTDLAVAAGSELILLKGRDRSFSGRSGPLKAAGTEAEAVSVSLPFDILAMASGNFLDDTRYRPELALLASDGAVHAVPRSVLADLVQGKLETAASDSLPVFVAAGAGAQGLVKVRGSNTTTDDLLLLGHPEEAAELLVTEPGEAFRHLLPQTSGTVAAITARLSADAYDDLVLLQAGRSEPTVQILNAPLGGGGSFLVNNTSIFGSGPLDGICDIDPMTEGDQCNLNEALSEAANFTEGTVTIQFAGDGPYESPGQDPVTVPLTIDGGAGGGDPNVQIILRSNLGLNAAPSVIRGVRVVGSFLFFRENAGGNLFENNWLGLDASGAANISNAAGLTVNTDNAKTTFGGSAPGAGNVIAARSAINSFSDGDVFRGNKIGTDKSGTLSLGTQPGTVLGIAGPSTLVGGTAVGDGNLISGNQFAVGVVVTGSGALVQGNLIGTDASGASPLGNGSAGVTVGSAADMVTIGGTALGAGNVISANSFPSGMGGLVISSTGTATVQGNIIGGDISGTVGLGNRGVGISLQTDGHTIGGTAGSAANTIVDSQAAPNDLRLAGNGIEMVFAATSDNLIQGNRIGVGLLLTPLGNQGHGIIIIGSAADNLVGGTDAGAGNEIMHNAGTGVLVSGNASQGNRILGNEIEDNGGLGIDLSVVTDPDGPTANDPGDGDGGPNSLQNHPVIDSVVGGTVQGSLASKPNTTYRVEVFANAACDPSGFGEGGTFLAATEVITDGNGDVDFLINSGGLNNPTATATDIATGDTSEFSACFPAEAPQAVVNSVGDDPDNDIGDGDCNTGGMIDREGVLEPECTLRAAFEEQLPEVRFDVPQAQYPPTGAPLIQPASPYPPITHAVTVDAGSQPGVGAVQVDFGQSGPGGDAPGGVGQISGELCPNPGVGLQMDETNIQVLSGMALFCYSDYGVWVSGSSGTLVDMKIGTDFANTPGLGGTIGVLIKDEGQGQPGEDQNQVINSEIVSNATGIQIEGPESLGNEVSGSFIGTTADSLMDLGNGNGVLISNAGSNTVSDSTIANNVTGVRVTGAAATGNQVAGNEVTSNATGIRLEENSAGSSVENNLVGTDGNGAELGNDFGIYIQNSSGNFIDDNTVANSSFDGITLDGSDGDGTSTTGNMVRRNRIGTDALGRESLGNAFAGILIRNARDNVIGGLQQLEGNVISNNGFNLDQNGGGIQVEGHNARGNQIKGNYIGTTLDGTDEFGNFDFGIAFRFADANTVGGTQPGEGNVISGSLGDGIYILSNGIADGTAPDIAEGQLILGNFIGTDRDGVNDVGNGEHGVNIEASEGNTIGAADFASGGNLISGNDGNGVRISQVLDFEQAVNKIIGNRIGTDLNDQFGLPNSGDGVMLEIDETLVKRNRIAHNTGAGVRIQGNSKKNNWITQNSIASNGALGIDLIGGNQDAFGVTENDPGDSDSGPNSLANFPIITEVMVTPSIGGLVATVRGSYDNGPDQPTIELFSSTLSDPSGHGEGETYLGRHLQLTGGRFTAVVGGTAVQSITATSSLEFASERLSTSEFSTAFVAPPPPPSYLVINEIDAVPTGQEFIELSSGGDGAVSLTGKVLVLYDGADDLSYAAIDLDGQFLDIDGFFAAGNAAVPGVGLVFDDGLLLDGPAAAALYDGNAVDFPDGTPVTTENLIDAVVYGPAGVPDAGLLVLLQPNQPQVDEAAAGGPGIDSLQRCPDSSGGERNTDTYQAAPPTPGEMNTCVVCYVEPRQTSADEGQDVALTATVLVNAITPMAGIDLDFEILSGPNAGEMGAAMTDAFGEAMFSYTGLGGAGEDAIAVLGTFGGVPFFCEAGVSWLVVPIIIDGFE